MGNDEKSNIEMREKPENKVYIAFSIAITLGISSHMRPDLSIDLPPLAHTHTRTAYTHILLSYSLHLATRKKPYRICAYIWLVLVVHTQ